MPYNKYTSGKVVYVEVAVVVVGECESILKKEWEVSSTWGNINAD